MNWIEQRQKWDEARETTETLQAAIAIAGSSVALDRLLGFADGRASNEMAKLAKTGGKRVTRAENSKRRKDIKMLGVAYKSTE